MHQVYAQSHTACRPKRAHASRPCCRVHGHTHACTHIHTHKQRWGGTLTNLCIQHLSDYSSVWRTAGEGERKTERGGKRRREGASKQDTTCLYPSFIPQLAVDSGSLSMGIRHRHTPGGGERERRRAYFLKNCCFEGVSVLQQCGVRTDPFGTRYHEKRLVWKLEK